MVMTHHRRKLSQPIRIVVRDGSLELINRVFYEYPIVIGRSANCDIPLATFDFISRQHAAVTLDAEQLVIVDLNSSNGFTFAGQKSKRAPLVPGADIRIGPLSIDFSYIKNEVVSDPFTATARLTPGEPTVLGANALKAEPQARVESEPQLVSLPAIEEDDDLEELEDLDEAPSLPPPVVPNTTGSWTGSGPTGLEIEVEKSVVVKQNHVTTHHLAAKLQPQNRALEAILTWTDQIYDSKTLMSASRLTVGSSPSALMYLPTLRRNVNFASYDGQKASCFVPQGTTIRIQRGEQNFSMTELMASHALTSKAGGYVYSLHDEDLATVEISPDVQIHFRYIPSPRRLAKGNLGQVTEDIQRSALISGFVHLFIVLLALFSSPPQPMPKIDNVPDRIARLLVPPPQPKPTPEPTPVPKPTPPPDKPKPTPQPKPEIQKIKEQVRQKIQPKPKPIKMVTNKQIEKINKELPTKPKPVDVSQLGALGALTALSNKVTTPQPPTALNINPNAGGSPSNPNLGGVVGVLKSAGGKLSAGGGVSGPKTKGLGYGLGQGYGVAGVKGASGNRAIAGAVVGNPQLMQIGASEGLTRNQVMDVVKRYLGKIQSCYERSLLSNPGLAGRIEYEWEISPSGQVVDARVRKAEVGGGDSLNNCVLAVFRSMTFPQAKNGQSTTPNIGFPFGRM